MDQGRIVRYAGIAALAALAAGCSKSSTAPTDPLVGTWNLTFTGGLAGSSLSPAPFPLRIDKSGSTYTLSYPNLLWLYPPATLDTFTETDDSSSYAIGGDTIRIRAHDAGAPACFFTMRGTFSGATGVGSAGSSGTMCTPGMWTWTAVKQ